MQSLGLQIPIELVESGITRGREVRCYGAKTAWYVSVGTLNGDFDINYRTVETAS